MKNWKSCLTAVLALAATTVFSAEPLLLQWGAIDTSGSAAQAESTALKAKVAKKAALARARKSAAPEERAAYIVQFPGPVTEEWRTWLESSTQVRGYLPEFAYLVWATASEMETIAANPDVFWTGEWKKDYKTVLVGSASPAKTTASATAGEARWMQVGSLLTGDDGAADFRARLEALPAEVQDAFPRLDGSSAVALLSDAQIDEVASWPDVEWIEPKLKPRLFNDKAALTNMMNVANAWKSLSSGGLGLTGAGQIVAVADTGCDKGSLTDVHADFAGRILAGYGWTNGAYKSSASWADLDAHGTHVCGSILGSGAASTNLYRGMAYEAQLVMQGMWEDLGGLPDHTATMLKQAYSAGARIHSDSWGYGTNYAGAYVYDSVYSDGYMWTNQNFLMVIAAGNDGIDANSDGVIDAGSVTAPGTAKNCICVGAAENYRTNGGYAASTYGKKWSSDYPADPIKSDKISQTNTPQGLAAFSGRGPTQDGRFKPDIVAPGTDVISVRSRASDDTGWGLNSANTNYIYMGGTSMATPLTSGTMALIRQWLVDRKGIDEPMAALMKALLINGARDMTPGQYGTAPPGNHRPPRPLPGLRPRQPLQLPRTRRRQLPRLRHQQADHLRQLHHQHRRRPGQRRQVRPHPRLAGLPRLLRRLQEPRQRPRPHRHLPLRHRLLPQQPLRPRPHQQRRIHRIHRHRNRHLRRQGQRLQRQQDLPPRRTALRPRHARPRNRCRRSRPRLLLRHLHRQWRPVRRCRI